MIIARVCILDYGSGNTRSVYNLIVQLAQEVKISNCSSDIRDATHIILPGVGAFGAAMSKIRSRIPLDILENEVLNNGKPFLGICVGMQVLAERGFEFSEHTGLGWVQGDIRKLDSAGLPLPHIGWNDISIVQANGLFSLYQDNPDFYFLHSFCYANAAQSDIAAECNYGTTFPCAIIRNNIHGVQFHPEKSQRAGRILISNFLSIA
jgi:glutamine amidotransferase